MVQWRRLSKRRFRQTVLQRIPNLNNYIVEGNVMPASRPGPTRRFQRWLRQFFVCAFVIAILITLGQSYSPDASRALAQSASVPDSPNILNTTLADFHLIGTQPNKLTD